MTNFMAACTFGNMEPGANCPSSQYFCSFCVGQMSQILLIRFIEVDRDLFNLGQDHQRVCTDVFCEQLCREVLIDNRCDTFQITVFLRERPEYRRLRR